MKPVRRWVVVRNANAEIIAVHYSRANAIDDAGKRTRESGARHTAIVQIVSAAVVITEFDQLRFKQLARLGRST